MALRTPLNLVHTAEPAGRRLLTGSSAQVVEYIQRYHDVGVQHMVFDVLTNDVPQIADTTERFANEARPRTP